MDYSTQTYLLRPELVSPAGTSGYLENFGDSADQGGNYMVQGVCPTIRKIIESKKASNYYWSDAQNKRYVAAVQKYQQLLALSAQERRLRKVNVLLSRKIRTRSPLQCHSHHQKMIKKYGSVEAIIHFALKERTQAGTVGNPEIKRRGRPPKKTSGFCLEAAPQVAPPPIPVAVCAAEDLLFNVLELGKNDLEQQELDRFIEQRLKMTLEEDEMMLMNI